MRRGGAVIGAATLSSRPREGKRGFRQGDHRTRGELLTLRQHRKPVGFSFPQRCGSQNPMSFRSRRGARGKTQCLFALAAVWEPKTQCLFALAEVREPKTQCLFALAGVWEPKPNAFSLSQGRGWSNPASESRSRPGSRKSAPDRGPAAPNTRGIRLSQEPDPGSGSRKTPGSVKRAQDSATGGNPWRNVVDW